MKFIIVAYWHDPRFRKKTGGLIRIFSLADNLLALGYHVHLILPRLGNPQKQTNAPVDEVPFIDLPILRPLSFHLLSSIYLLYRCFRGRKKVYVRQMNSFLPLLIARLTGAFTYYEIPNDPFIAYNLYQPWKRTLVKGIDSLSWKLAHRVVVLSHWTKGRLLNFTTLKGEKIIVFPSGTDTELFHPTDKGEACNILGLDPGYYYIGFIGSFLAYQGLETVIRAAPRIVSQVPITRFLFVGDGPMKPAWEKEVKKLGLEKHFIFPGQVPYREVPLYLGAMDICVAPHRADSNQSSPVKIFDYLAAGKAVVASDVEAVREIVNDRTIICLSRPNSVQDWSEKILFLLKEKDLRQEMGLKAREYAVKNFDRRTLTARTFPLKIKP